MNSVLLFGWIAHIYEENLFLKFPNLLVLVVTRYGYCYFPRAIPPMSKFLVLYYLPFPSIIRVGFILGKKKTNLAVILLKLKQHQQKQ